MSERQEQLHILAGLDDRDLALLATACSDRAHFLAHLATGHYEDSVAIRAGCHHDPSQASDDAERLYYIATVLDHRRQSR